MSYNSLRTQELRPLGFTALVTKNGRALVSKLAMDLISSKVEQLDQDFEEHFLEFLLFSVTYLIKYNYLIKKIVIKCNYLSTANHTSALSEHI